MFLVRKIARAKWDATRNAARGLTDGEISADAVTADLRTQEGTLSFWQCSAEANGDLEDAVLAIAAASERLDKIEVVWLAVEDLETDGHTLRDSNGGTPVVDLVKRHVDICELDYVRLGKVAERVVDAIRLERRDLFTKKRVKELLLTAIKQGRVNPDRLADGLRNALGLQARRQGWLKVLRRAFLFLRSQMGGILTSMVPTIY